MVPSGLQESEELAKGSIGTRQCQRPLDRTWVKIVACYPRSSESVRRRSLHVFNDQYYERSCCGHEFQSKLLFQRGRKR